MDLRLMAIKVWLEVIRTSLVELWERICLPMQELWVQSPGQEYPLEKEMATHSSILGWEVSWTEVQYSWLGNPVDRGAWRATVHGITKSQMQLND